MAFEELVSDLLNTYFMNSGVDASDNDAGSSLTFSVEDIAFFDDAAAEDTEPAASATDGIFRSILIAVSVGVAVMCMITLCLVHKKTPIANSSDHSHGVKTDIS